MTNASVKGEQESGICNASAILEVSGKLNLLMNLNQVPSIVLGFFNFHFPIDFIGVSRGVSRGSVRGQLTGGQCFVETRFTSCAFACEGSWLVVNLECAPD